MSNRSSGAGGGMRKLSSTKEHLEKAQKQKGGGRTSSVSQPRNKRGGVTQGSIASNSRKLGDRKLEGRNKSETVSGKEGEVVSSRERLKGLRGSIRQMQKGIVRQGKQIEGLGKNLETIWRRIGLSGLNFMAVKNGIDDLLEQHKKMREGLIDNLAHIWNGLSALEDAKIRGEFIEGSDEMKVYDGLIRSLEVFQETVGKVLEKDISNLSKSDLEDLKLGIGFFKEKVNPTEMKALNDKLPEGKKAEIDKLFKGLESARDLFDDAVKVIEEGFKVPTRVTYGGEEYLIDERIIKNPIGFIEKAIKEIGKENLTSAQKWAIACGIIMALGIIVAVTAALVGALVFSGGIAAGVIVAGVVLGLLAFVGSGSGLWISLENMEEAHEAIENASDTANNFITKEIPNLLEGFEKEEG